MRTSGGLYRYLASAVRTFLCLRFSFGLLGFSQGPCGIQSLYENEKRKCDNKEVYHCHDECAVSEIDACDIYRQIIEVDFYEKADKRRKDVIF